MTYESILWEDKNLKLSSIKKTLFVTLKSTDIALDMF